MSTIDDLPWRGVYEELGDFMSASRWNDWRPEEVAALKRLLLRAAAHGAILKDERYATWQPRTLARAIEAGEVPEVNGGREDW